MKIPTTLKHKPVIVCENDDDAELLGERFRTLSRMMKEMGYE